MHGVCVLTRFLVGWLGIYEVIRFIWTEVEKIQFEVSTFQYSIADKLVCTVVALALNLFLVCEEAEGL